MADGFNIVAAPSEPEEDGDYALLFDRVDVPEDIDNFQLDIFSRVNELGGVYDGWDTEVVKE